MYSEWKSNYYDSQKANSHVAKFKELDTHIQTEIRNNSEGLLQENILKLWKEDSKKEELTSLQHSENMNPTSSENISTTTPFLIKSNRKGPNPSLSLILSLLPIQKNKL